MKLSKAVLAASLVEAELPWSACYQNGNPEICAKSCQSKLLWKAFRREMYGSDSWVYKVFGTEKLVNLFFLKTNLKFKIFNFLGTIYGS